MVAVILDRVPDLEKGLARLEPEASPNRMPQSRRPWSEALTPWVAGHGGTEAGMPRLRDCFKQTVGPPAAVTGPDLAGVAIFSAFIRPLPNGSCSFLLLELLP